MKRPAILLAFCAALLAAEPLVAQSPALAEKSEQARALMAAAKYEEAVPLYRELVRALPGNTGLELNLGLALHMSGREKEAIPQFERVLKAEPASLPANLYLGYTYLSLGQPVPAVAPLERAVRAAPDDQDARESLAGALLATDQFAGAAEQFHRLAGMAGGSAPAWYGLGRSYQALAQQSFDRLGKLAAGSGYWLALAADARLKDQQLSSAFYLYRQALDKMPKLRGAHAALAEIYGKTGHADWGATETGREKQLGPPDCGVDPLECDFVARRYEQVVSAPAGTPDALFWKTKAYNELAVLAFAHLGEHQDSAEFHELMAAVHSGEGQSRQAVEEWQQAYQLSGRDPGIGVQLAIATIDIKDYPGAQKLAEDLLQRQPDSAELRYVLGYALLGRQEPPKAIAELETALRLDPKLLQAHQALAQALLQAGQSAQAIPHLKAALPLDKDGSLHYQLARAYQSAGQTALAQATLETYRKMQEAAAEERQSTMEEVKISPP